MGDEHRPSLRNCWSQSHQLLERRGDSLSNPCCASPPVSEIVVMALALDQVFMVLQPCSPCRSGTMHTALVFMTGVPSFTNSGTGW